jgi:hypothetical protein
MQQSAHVDHMLAVLCVVFCRSTLVVDDLEEARSLCYGSDRHKVVSIDGTMFKPNGTFTGDPGLKLFCWPLRVTLLGGAGAAQCWLSVARC